VSLSSSSLNRELSTFPKQVHYASWQKGGIENANGRLRRWLPRNLDIDQVSDQDIQEIILTANLTPRKCLGFKTPFQAILAELGKDVKIRFA
jgi:transposase, IS30 family